MVYSLDHKESNTQSTEIDLDLDWITKTVLEKNQTLYVHARLSANSPFHTPELQNGRHKQILELSPSVQDFFPPVMGFEGSVPLTAYYQKSKLNKKSNLMGDGVEMPEEIETGQAALDAEDETYYPYFKQELNLHVIHDKTVYKDSKGFVPLVAHLSRFDGKIGIYNPIMYLSDFWHLMRDLVLIDEESISRISKVKAGEVQEGKEGMDEH